MWITILLQLLPLILEMIKKWLERERQAAVAGHDGPAMAFVKAAQTSLASDGWMSPSAFWKAYSAGSVAYNTAEARMPPPA